MPTVPAHARCSQKAVNSYFAAAEDALTPVFAFSLGPAMIAEQGTLFTHTLSSVQGPQLVIREVGITESPSVAVNRDIACVKTSEFL